MTEKFQKFFSEVAAFGTAPPARGSVEGVEAVTDVRAARLGGTRRGSTSERADVLRKNRFSSGGFEKGQGSPSIDLAR